MSTLTKAAALPRVKLLTHMNPARGKQGYDLSFEAHSYIVMQVDDDGRMLLQCEYSTLAEAQRKARQIADAQPEFVVRVYEERGYWRAPRNGSAALFRRFDAVG